MKKVTLFMMLVVTMIVMTCCSADSPYGDYYGMRNGDGMMNAGGNSSTTGELTSFDVTLDQSATEPSEVATAYFPDEEDKLENNEFSTLVNIDMAHPETKTENGVEVMVNNGHITANHNETKGVCYVVSGTTANGSLTILGEKKYAVKLNGVNITNPDSAALNLLSSKRAFILLADGTSNSLADGTGGSQKGALYCKGKLLFNGTGSLTIIGNTNNGIHSADYIVFNKGNNIYVKSTANHGVKANDGVFINGGLLNIEVSAAAAKGINSESHIVVNGGRTAILTTGNGIYDSEDQEAKGAACIKTDSMLTINGGELWLKSTGSGGKGINSDASATFNGGNVYVVTTGSQYKSNNDTSSPKGIKADGNISITGGRIWVRTEGTNGEGIETKKELVVTGGEVASYAYDDAINSKSTMTINGGMVFAQGKKNDGLDANGNCYINGGTVYAVSAGTPEVAIDANTEGGYKLYINGGTIVAIGGVERGACISQPYNSENSWISDTWYALSYGGTVFAFKTPTSGGSGIVVSANEQPTLLSGVNVSGGTTYFGGLGIYLSEE